MIMSVSKSAAWCLDAGRGDRRVMGSFQPLSSALPSQSESALVTGGRDT